MKTPSYSVFTGALIYQHRVIKSLIFVNLTINSCNVHIIMQSLDVAFQDLLKGYDWELNNMQLSDDILNRLVEVVDWVNEPFIINFC